MNVIDADSGSFASPSFGTVDSFSPTGLHSNIRQSWDGLGRRSRIGLGGDIAPLGSTAPAFDYDFYASDRLATIAPGAFSDPWEVQYDYEDNRLLSERRFRVNSSYNARRTQTLNRRLDDTTPYRDARGRLLRNVQTAGGIAVLNETLAWSADSKLGSYTLARGPGTGTAWDDFTDSRNHSYDPDNRRLETETFLPEPGGSPRTFNYDFDSGDLGVRVKAALDNPAIDAWEVPDPDTTGLEAFKRIVDETARPEERSFTASGSSTGPGVFELFLGAGASPPNYEFLQAIDPDVDYGDGNWSVPLSLAVGQYTLEARATHLHPDSNYQVTDSSTFTVAAPDPASIITTYDAHGRVATRSWASGDVVQTFSWDAKGKLLEIEQVDSGTTETVGSYVWTAQYDGLGRRFQTDYAPAGASAIAIAQNRIKTWFDPQVEFMPAAIEHHGKREWMVHGPDLDTGYGAFQGLGGLEAIVDETTGRTTPIVDTVHGHVVATIDLGDIGNAADDTISFKEQQFGGYGPLPGSQQQPLEVTESLAASLGWQTRCIDPTSFFAMGARHYDPLSGRFLSADPLGHGATPDLYSYAGGDPINFVDPTGRAFDSSTFFDEDYNRVEPPAPESFGEFVELMTDFTAAVVVSPYAVSRKLNEAADELVVDGFSSFSEGDIIGGYAQTAFGLVWGGGSIISGEVSEIPIVVPKVLGRSTYFGLAANGFLQDGETDLATNALAYAFTPDTNMMQSFAGETTSEAGSTIFSEFASDAHFDLKDIVSPSAFGVLGLNIITNRANEYLDFESGNENRPTATKVMPIGVNTPE